MTLSRMQRYDGTQVDSWGGDAVVVGASMAGLLSARVLADAYDTVTVVDGDPLPDEPVTRRGVPQAGHPHAMLEAGRVTIEDLFPGYSESVVSDGGLLLDWAKDQWDYAEGGYLAAGTERIPMYSASRALFEQHLRRRTAQLPDVSLRGNCQCIGYRTEDGSAVSGVRVRDNGTERELPADLVVDATGRTSRTPNWLDRHGYTPPETDEVHIDIRYSTIRIERPPSDRRAFFMIPAPGQPRGWGAFPVEGDEWIVTLSGVHDADPPTDRAGFLDYADKLPTTFPRRFLDHHDWLTDEIEAYPFPANRRRCYEDLDRFPEGLVVVGDAIASFNPTYGQGMSVAALEALALHHCLAEGYRADIGPAFFERAAPVVDIAWLMAVGADVNFEATAGDPPMGAGLFDRYLSRLHRKAHTDPTLVDAVGAVAMMKKPPSSLFRPSTLRRVLLPGGGDGQQAARSDPVLARTN